MSPGSERNWRSDICRYHISFTPPGNTKSADQVQKVWGIEVADQVGSPGELVLILVMGPTS